MTKGRLIQVCANCPSRHNVAGVVTCGRDGRDIMEHARNNDCPEGRFSMTAPPVATIPDDYDPAHYALDSKGTEGCGC